MKQTKPLKSEILTDSESNQLFGKKANGDIDDTIDGFNAFYDDIKEGIDEDIGKEIEEIESEISNSYTDTYEDIIK